MLAQVLNRARMALPVVSKQADPQGPSQVFDFTGTASGHIEDGQNIEVLDLVSGEYTSTENPVTNWGLAFIVCDDKNSSGNIANSDQVDGDGDGYGDLCDACPADPNNDADADGLCGDLDNCPAIANPGQEDADADFVGDACDNCEGFDDADCFFSSGFESY